MSVHPELLIDDEGSELRVKAKAKGVSHTCGQLPLTVAEDVAPEQVGLLETIESLVERVHGMFTEIAALHGEEGGEEMPSIDAIRLWDRATIDQVDRWATAVLAVDQPDHEAVPPLPRVLGGEAGPAPGATRIPRPTTSGPASRTPSREAHQRQPGPPLRAPAACAPRARARWPGDRRGHVPRLRLHRHAGLLAALLVGRERPVLGLSASGGGAVSELLLFASLAAAVIALCLALDESDERRDAARRHHPRRVR